MKVSVPAGGGPGESLLMALEVSDETPRPVGRDLFLRTPLSPRFRQMRQIRNRDEPAVVTMRGPGANRAVVLRIVADVLEVPAVAASDSFYDFGGTSLQAMRICARIGRELGVEIAAQTLFDSDTLADVISATERGARSRA